MWTLHRPATSLFTDLLSRVDWCWNVCMMYVCVHVWREVFRGHRVRSPPSSPTHARGIRTAGGGRASVDRVSERCVPSMAGTTRNRYKVHSQRGGAFLILSLSSASCLSFIFGGFLNRLVREPRVLGEQLDGRACGDWDVGEGASQPEHLSLPASCGHPCHGDVGMVCRHGEPIFAEAPKRWLDWSIGGHGRCPLRS